MVQATAPGMAFEDNDDIIQVPHNHSQSSMAGLRKPPKSVQSWTPAFREGSHSHGYGVPTSQASGYSASPRPDDQYAQDIKKKLNAVVSPGSQFVEMPASVTRKPHLPDLAFLQRTVFARISVGINGQQLKKNGAPKLLRMAWTFKWRLISPDRPSIDSSLATGHQIAMKVKSLPAIGQHNLIHVDGTMTSSTEIGVDPKVSVAGISAELGSWKKVVGNTSTPFTTFCLSATPNPGQLAWRWAKIEQNKNLRDPDLTYLFGFRFTFEEPFDTKQEQPGGPDTTSVPPKGDLAVEVTLCDFAVTFEPTFLQVGDYTLSYPVSALYTCCSNGCDLELDEAWPIPGIQHFRCEGCGTMQPPTPTSVTSPLPA